MARSSRVRVSCLDSVFVRSLLDCRRGSSGSEPLSRLMRLVGCTGLASFLSESFPDEAPRFVIASLIPSCSKRTRFLAIFASRSSSLLDNSSSVCGIICLYKHVLLRFWWHNILDDDVRIELDRTKMYVALVTHHMTVTIKLLIKF